MEVASFVESVSTSEITPLTVFLCMQMWIRLGYRERRSRQSTCRVFKKHE